MYAWAQQYSLLLPYLCSFNDWDLETSERFFETLYSAHILGSGMDKMYWVLSKKHRFDAKSFYGALLSFIYLF